MNPNRLILSKRTIIATLAAVAANVASHAYDITSTGSDGQQYYFNILSSTEAELTYCDSIAHGHYTGIADIPSTVGEYTVSAIGEGAFCNCTQLTGVAIPSTVTRIGPGAFAWCFSLSDFTVPSQVQEIGQYAFQGCITLNEFAVEAGNSHFDTYDGVLLSKDGTQLIAYPGGREGALVVPSSVTSLAEGCFYDCYLLSSISIPLSVSNIEKNALYNCGAVKSINIPANLTTIERSAFGECVSLEKFTVSPDNPVFSTDSMALYTTDGMLTHFAPSSTSSYNVADGTTAIGAEAFFRDYQLVSLTLPDGLKAIGDIALAECWELATIELPSTVDSIGFAAFALCEGLSSIYSHIEDPTSVQLGDLVFYGIDQNNCKLYVPQGTREAYEAAAQWSDFATITEFTTLLDQEIIWEQSLEDLSIGVEIQLNAYATSKLDVEYVILQGDNLASIDGSHLTISEESSVIIQARQEGNSTYRPARPITRSVGISALESINYDNIEILGCKGYISIDGAPVKDIARVYRADGRLVYQGLSRRILLRPGVYVTTISGTSAKVLVQ